MELNEFVKRLEVMQKQYPADASDALEEAAEDMRKAIRKATPHSRRKHPHKLRRGWKLEMVDLWGKAPEAHIRNTSPHYHLVERGVQHPKDPHGNPKPEWLDSLNRNKGFTEKAVKNNWPKLKEKMAKDFYQKVRDHLG